MKSNLKTFAWAMLFAALCTPALPAQDIPVDDLAAVHPNQRLTVPDLATVTARDSGRPEVVKAALAIVFSVSRLQCDSGSQIESAAEAGAGASLRALAAKLSGASCRVNGRTLRASASFVPNAAIQANNLIASLKNGQPLLLEWKGALYVLYGVIYDERVHYSGRQENVIRELLLIDPRYADQRRLVSFNRAKDDFVQVEGIASVSVSR